MTEFMKIIAEVEGVRTPTRKRTKKEVEKAYEDHQKARAEKSAKRTKAKAAKPAASAKKAATSKKAEPQAVESKPAIERVKVSENPGNIVAAGYDENSKRMHVEFKASVYEYPGIEKSEWTAFEATFEKADIDTGSYFRKNFRGKTFRKLNQPTAAKAASADQSKSGEVTA